MDPHRLARFLEGESDETERARTLSDLAELPTEQLDVFAEAAAVLRANEREGTEPPDAGRAGHP
jgi:hypothetical protein